MVESLCQWITTYLASYLEDLADVSENFSHREAVTLGQAGASIIKNITDRFYELPTEDREQLIEALKTAAFTTEEPFIQTFRRSES